MGATAPRSLPRPRLNFPHRRSQAPLQSPWNVCPVRSCRVKKCFIQEYFQNLWSLGLINLTPKYARICSTSCRANKQQTNNCTARVLKPHRYTQLFFSASGASIFSINLQKGSLWILLPKKNGSRENHKVVLFGKHRAPLPSHGEFQQIQPEIYGPLTMRRYPPSQQQLDVRCNPQFANVEAKWFDQKGPSSGLTKRSAGQKKCVKYG